MRNVWFAVCSHAALTWIQLRQRETIRNGKIESAFSQKALLSETSVFQIGHIGENVGSEANAGSDLRLASRIGPDKFRYRGEYRAFPS
jgi:hypothetical protein